MSIPKRHLGQEFSITPDSRHQPHLNKINHLTPKIPRSQTLTVEDGPGRHRHGAGAARIRPDPELRALAAAIIAAQEQEIAFLHSWLKRGEKAG
jgi:hypothetical protein